MTLPHKHPHVEDYIEIIAGYRDVSGKRNYSSGFGGLMISCNDPLISLARYDTKVIPNLAEQTLVSCQGYTDRQATLAVSLVLKYERQLAKLGLDVSPIHNPQYRLPVRQIDRTSKVWVADGIIKLRFPYNLDLIEAVRVAAKESKGFIRFNREQKLQEIALTEWNVNWVHTFATENNVEIDSSVQELFDLIIDVEKTLYAIELNYIDNKLSITNAPNSLLEHIEEHYGGLNPDNAMRIMDIAPVLGFSIAADLEQTVIAEFGERFWSLCANRQLKVGSSAGISVVKDIAEYATATQRFPIFVYEPDLSGRLLNEFTELFPDQVVKLENKKIVEITLDTKVIYTSKIPRQPFASIPLMITSAGMLYGGDRQLWIQTAEKIIYFSKDVYTKTIKDKICELN